MGILDFSLLTPTRTLLSGFIVGVALGAIWALLSLYLHHGQPVMGY